MGLTATSSASEVASWYDAYARDVYVYVSRRIGGGEAAADIVHDTFRTALESHSEFDPARGQPRAWLFGIASNHLRRAWRSGRREQQALLRLASSIRSAEPPNNDAAIDATRTLTSVKAVFDELAVEDVEVLVLTAWEGMNSTEIGQVLGLPSGTVRSRLHRARATLRRAIHLTTSEEGDCGR